MIDVFENQSKIKYKVLFDEFKCIDRINFGGFSTVYRVYSSKFNKELCLKVERIEDSKLLKHEFSVGKLLDKECINLCRIYDFYVSSYEHGMTMEILGDSLSKIRDMRRDPPSIPMFLYIISQTLNALDSLHSRKILHHDIKPSNIAFRLRDDNEYDIVLFDYGLSKYEGESTDAIEFRDKLSQNPRYLSINFQKTNVYTEVDDIISLLYSISYLWKGILPWSGRTTAKLIYEEKINHELRDLVPPEISFMVDNLESGTSNLKKLCDIELSKYKRDIPSEIRYLTADKDEGYERPRVELIFDPIEKPKFKNNHSA